MLLGMHLTMARRPIAYLLLLAYLPACMSWQVERGISPEHMIADQRPDTIRVTRLDDSRIVLVQPRIVPGDSVNAIHNGYRARLALSDITQIETKRFNAGTTVGGAVVISVVTVAIALVALKGAWKGKWGCWMGCS